MWLEEFLLNTCMFHLKFRCSKLFRKISWLTTYLILRSLSFSLVVVARRWMQRPINLLKLITNSCLSFVFVFILGCLYLSLLHYYFRCGSPSLNYLCFNRFKSHYWYLRNISSTQRINNNTQSIII